MMDDLELDLVAEAIDRDGYHVGALRIRQAILTIRELEAENAKLREHVRELEKWAREMVEIQASGGKLDGYRELASKLCDAIERAEKAEATLARIAELPEKWRLNVQIIPSIERIDALNQ